MGTDLRIASEPCRQYVRDPTQRRTGDHVECFLGNLRVRCVSLVETLTPSDVQLRACQWPSTAGLTVAAAVATIGFANTAGAARANILMCVTANADCSANSRGSPDRAATRQICSSGLVDDLVHKLLAAEQRLWSPKAQGARLAPKFVECFGAYRSAHCKCWPAAPSAKCCAYSSGSECPRTHLR